MNARDLDPAVQLLEELCAHTHMALTDLAETLHHDDLERPNSWQPATAIVEVDGKRLRIEWIADGARVCWGPSPLSALYDAEPLTAYGKTYPSAEIRLILTDADTWEPSGRRPHSSMTEAGERVACALAEKAVAAYQQEHGHMAERLRAWAAVMRRDLAHRGAQRALKQTRDAIGDAAEVFSRAPDPLAHLNVDERRVAAALTGDGMDPQDAADAARRLPAVD